MKILSYDWHQKKGAIFEDFFGCEIPSHYGNYEQEYQAIRNAAGIRDVSYFGKVKVTGRDRQKFLHAMLSNNIKSLQPGQGTLATLLDVKGHIQADIKLYVFEEYLLMVLQHYVSDKIVNTLDRYVIGEDLQMKNVTDQYGMLQILGPQAEGFLRSKKVSDPPTELYSFRKMNIEGVEAWLIRLGTGYALLCNATDTAVLLDSLDAPVIGMRAFEIFRIESGLPLMGYDIGESNFPQESRLDAALDFNKGCYLGQEVMARIDAQGHVNKFLTGIASSTALQPGDKIYRGDKEIGKITSATFSLKLSQPLGLAYVRREFAKEGESVEVGNDRAAAIVKQLPV